MSGGSLILVGAGRGHLKPEGTVAQEKLQWALEKTSLEGSCPLAREQEAPQRAGRHPDDIFLPGVGVWFSPTRRSLCWEEARPRAVAPGVMGWLVLPWGSTVRTLPPTQTLEGGNLS